MRCDGYDDDDDVWPFLVPGRRPWSVRFVSSALTKTEALHIGFDRSLSLSLALSRFWNPSPHAVPSPLPPGLTRLAAAEPAGRRGSSGSEKPWLSTALLTVRHYSPSVRSAATAALPVAVLKICRPRHRLSQDIPPLRLLLLSPCKAGCVCSQSSSELCQLPLKREQQPASP